MHKQVYETMINHMKGKFNPITKNRRSSLPACSSGKGPSTRPANTIRWSSRVTAVLFLLALALFSSCEHDIAVSTAVHPDGSLDRTILLHEVDSSNAENNIFGINSAGGWHISMAPLSETADEEDQKSKINITFKKHFASTAAADSAMNSEVDTAFHIASTFEKHNRWFYTYIEYRDTYKALNLFNAIPKEQYFTREDFAFIDRLPSEGTAISKADSLYLARLNEKVFDVYGSRTVFEEFFQHLMATMRKENVASRWQDTVTGKKENIYREFIEDGDFLDVIDRFDVPLPAAAKESIQRNNDLMEKRLEFLSKAYSGKYVHIIEMPWTVIESNADSIASNQLFWRPPVLKFLLSDYTMSVTVRRMNVWSIVLSAMIILATVALFFRQRAKS